MLAGCQLDSMLLLDEGTGRINELPLGDHQKLGAKRPVAAPPTEF